MKWSYENYRGASAKVLHEKTRRHHHRRRPHDQVPISRSRFSTSRSCSAPAMSAAPAGSCRQSTTNEVGKDGFLQKPIGAGPYQLVSQEPGTKLEFEAFEDYYRPVHIKQLRDHRRARGGDPHRDARARARPTCSIWSPGELIERVKRELEDDAGAGAVRLSGGSNSPVSRIPKNPFHDKRVRQAVSLAIDRKAINDAECGGMGKVSGNWINDDVEYALEWPELGIQRRQGQGADDGGRPPERVQGRLADRRAELLSRAASASSRSCRRSASRPKLQTMERGVYLKKMEGGLKEWPGVQIIMNATRIGGSWANWYEGMFKCGGFQGQDMYLRQGPRRQVRAIPDIVRPRRTQEAGRGNPARRSSTIIISCRCSATPSSTRSGRGSRRRNGRTCSRRSPRGYAYPWEDIQLTETAAARG